MTSSVDTTTLRALLATIISQPDEDTPRLEYADVLMDSDHALDRALGEYIKLSIELHNHKKLVKPRIDTSLKQIEHRNDGYKGVDSYDWYRKGIELSERSKELLSKCYAHPNFQAYSGILTLHGVELTIERGFISSITCTASQFLSICDKLIWHESMEDMRVKKGKSIKIGELVHNGDKVEMVQRPCPLTAHPVRKIEITDNFNKYIDHEFDDTPIGSILNIKNRIYRFDVEQESMGSEQYAIEFTRRWPERCLKDYFKVEFTIV